MSNKPKSEFRRRFGLSAPEESHTPATAFPARLDARQVAKALGFQENDIAILILNDLLEPLGTPAPNAKKYFARKDVFTLADNDEWLDEATDAVYGHWQKKNASRKSDETISVTA